MNMERHLNIIAFNIPWPANYGGVIDVYYKMEALHRCGVKIILHCFEYERPHAPELEALCEKVYYYRRKTGLCTNMTLLPYNVYSRKDPELLRNLLENDYPILFEGLHCCYYLSDPRLKNRMKIYREANIEHDYYHHLAEAESHPERKCFFFIEAWRFRRYERVLAHADLMIAVSTTDTEYLSHRFPGKQVRFMPCFHTNDRITTQTGPADFILYHGKLSVVENTKAALFLIRHVFSRLDCLCVIAGMDPPASLLKAARPFPNIRIVANPSEEEMSRLIREAQIHLLVTFQATGLKLKLLNSLFAGRHAVVNRLMVEGSGLEPLCRIADTPAEMIRACRELMPKEVDPALLRQRRDSLYPVYSNQYQGELLTNLIYGQES